MVGVLSERDLVRAYARHGATVMSFKVNELMTTEVTSCKPGDSVKEAMSLMSRRHIRHLPVLDSEGALIAMISQRDVMATRLEQTEMETDELRAFAIASGGSAGLSG